MDFTWEDLCLIFVSVIVGFLLAIIIIIGIPISQPDNTNEKIKCEKEGGVWTEVVHNKSLSYCTYFNNGG